MHLLQTLPFLSVVAGALSPSFSGDSAQLVLQEGAIKVPVELGVMSRCPDALFCEGVFDQVLKVVGPKADIKLVYVAEYARRIITASCGT
ncbi:hypothetical protein FB451DRAFT_1203528 [Mycena latifolia]|nr:hypothetical protein FB451DRAFT_1203528 [Mycena latifolia]